MVFCGSGPVRDSRKTDVYIALTGGIGSGKTSVSAWLSLRGARIFDADAAVHEILKDPETVQWAQELWGSECLAQCTIHNQSTKHNVLDTKSISRIIFNDAQARKDWEGFIHPQVGRSLDHWLSSLEPKSSLIVFDIPLYFETNWGQGRRIDEVWVVYAAQEKRVERLEHQRGMSREDINARLAAQMPLEEKAAKADVVIDNSGSWEVTLRQLEDIMRRFEPIDS
jgi:dephospho-CoA kinase